MNASELRAIERSAAGWSCLIRPFGVEIVVGCSASLAPALERQLSPWSARATPEPREALVWLTGPTPDAPERPYTLHERDDVLLTVARPGELMVAVQQWMDREVARRATGMTPVHAGVVRWQGRAILLPGTSGAGKTALVRALIRGGAAYCSDELALIDARGWVHAYPRHLIVRDDRGIGRSIPLDPGSEKTEGAIPAAMMVGLRFDAAASFAVEPITCSQALLVLLANSAHRLVSVTAVPAGMLHLAGTAASYRGTRGDADAASDAILRLAERCAS